MPNPAPIRLDCVVEEGDGCEVVAEPDRRQVMLLLDLKDYPDDQSLFVQIDEEGARRLFNWLGVLLHAST